jgi:hypothetical protein
MKPPISRTLALSWYTWPAIERLMLISGAPLEVSWLLLARFFLSDRDEQLP